MYSEVLYIVKRIIHFYKSHSRLMYYFSNVYLYKTNKIFIKSKVYIN